MGRFDKGPTVRLYCMIPGWIWVNGRFANLILEYFIDFVEGYIATFEEDYPALERSLEVVRFLRGRNVATAQPNWAQCKIRVEPQDLLTVSTPSPPL